MDTGPAATCADQHTYAELKNVIFDAAIKEAVSETKLFLPKIEQQTTIKVEMPVLDSFDAATKKISCSGRVTLSLPAGVIKAGDNDLTADVKYTSQPSADGTGTVYAVLGGGEMVSAIASSDLSDWQTRVEPSSPPPPPVVSAVATDGAMAGGGESSTTTTTETTTTADDRVYATSFGCGQVHHFDEVTICHDSDLAAQDLQLSKLYRAAVAADTTGQVKERARLAWNERRQCTTPQCVREWYTRRITEMSAETSPQ